MHSFCARSLFLILAPAAFICALPLDSESQQPAPLRFRPDGSLHISVFNDLHYGEDEANPDSMGWGPISDVRTNNVLSSILDSELPDLAVINGDLITGENTFEHNATHYLDQIFAPLVRTNIRWAVTYGNHDSDHNVAPSELFQREKMMWPKLSMTRNSVPGDQNEVGISNYYIPVFGHSSKDVPSLLLWFFDSRGGRRRGDDARERTDFVSGPVVSWFTSTRDTLNRRYGKIIPSLGFVHIPPGVMPVFQMRGIDPSKEPGLNADKPAAAQSRDDGLPFVRALVDTKGLLGVFSGHDHGNDWCHRWSDDQTVNGMKGSGITFCFGGHTGYGGYGKWARGSRTLSLKEDRLSEFETWMRLEDRSIKGRIKVDANFGVDRVVKRRLFS